MVGHFGTTGPSAPLWFKDRTCQRFMAPKRETVVNLHRCAAACLCALIWSLTAAQTSAASTAPGQTLPSSFIALTESAISGSFEEIYSVAGPPRSGTVEVAQDAARGVRPFITGPGMWSFVYQTKSGISSQWIEKGPTVWDCWHFSGVTTWTCSGPGSFRAANGVIESVAPYIPGLVLTELQQLQEGLKAKPPLVKHVSFFDSKSAHFGPLRCLRANAVSVGTVSACFDRHGILVTQHGDLPFWTSITLLRFRSAVPHSAFQLLGPSRSSGSSFTAAPS